MKSSRNKLVLSCILLGTLSSINAAEDLGIISVDSTTIDDKYDAKSLEVSNTVILKGSDIEEKHSENIANVLNEVPGLTVRINEGDSNKIHIRGISTEMYMGEKPGVAIVIDGVPVQERSGSVNIDSDNIESIKIIKGGASYLYGNDALAGAVIITTKRPKAKNDAKVAIERGSFNYEKYLAKINKSTDIYALEVQGSYKASDGYWEDSDYWAKSLNGKFQYYLDDSSDLTFGIDKSTRFENDSGSLTYVVSGIDQVKTNPTSVGEVGYSTKYDITLDKYFLTYSKDFENDSNLMTQVYSYEDTTTNRNGAFDGDSTNSILRDDHKFDAYANTIQNGLKSEYRVDGDTIASMLGLSIARNEEDKNSVYRVDYTSRGVTTLKGTVDSDTTSQEGINAIYGEVKYKISDKLLTSVNLRHDVINYDYENKLTNKEWDTSFNESSYKVGASYKLDKENTLYTNTSSGFRVPTLAQMYAGDMSTSTYSGTYSNNTNIDTEKTYNYELGIRSQNRDFSYDVSIYNLDRKDVIGRSSGNYASTKGVNLQYDNMADIQNRGLEFSFKTNSKKTISYSFNYTYLDSKYLKYDTYTLILNEAGTDQNADGDTTDDYVKGTYNLKNNVVPRTSKHTINMTINYKIIPKLLLTTNVNYRSSQYADELNQIKVADYGILNLKSTYKMKIFSYESEIFAKVDNALDKQYFMMPRVTGDRNDDGVYDKGDMGLTVNPGVTYYAGLSVKF